MKKLLVVAALLSLPLAGCATADGSSRATPGAQATASGSYYCWKDRLNTQGDQLLCNWEQSAGDACRSSAIVTPLAKGSVASGPKDAGRCTNGQWLVQVTTK
jgi:Flp pilus assembly protein TadD